MRWLYRLHAFVFGYFWLPCPNCGEMFGGNEWRRCGVIYRAELDGEVRGRMICPACKAAGFGNRPPWELAK